MPILRLSLILIGKSLLKCLVVNDKVNIVYLMTSFSMSRSLLLQLASRQFFVLTGATGLILNSIHRLHNTQVSIL